jgi:membrane associated rhomboid family serine protease
MKNKPSTDTRPEMPPWPVILTTLTLVLAYAWLVFMWGWEPWKALCVVALAAFGVIFALLGAIMVFENPEERAKSWQVAMKTFRDDMDLLLKFFRLRK